MSCNDPANQTSVEDLLGRWIPVLYGFALQKTGRMDQAEELASRMAEGLYRSLLVQGLPECPSAYVWRLARNHWARWLRDKARHDAAFGVGGQGPVCFDEVVHSPREQGDPSDALVRQETLGLLRREIAWLSGVQRQVVVLHYFEARSVVDIARALAIPPGTVKWHLSAARQEIRKGMDTMRSAGTLGIRPVVFAGGLWLNGDPGREELDRFGSRRLSQNIIYACYRQDRNLEEIAAELGLSPVYVEEEVQILEDYGILEPRKSRRWRSRICLTEWTPDTVQRVTALYRSHVPRLARVMVDHLEENGDAIASCGVGYPDSDRNTLLWTLVPLAMNLVGMVQCRDDGVDAFRIPRPDGGRNIIGATIMPDLPQGADRGCLSGHYGINGAMHHHSTATMPGMQSPEWYTWRIDTFWNRRKCHGWDLMQREYEWMHRFLGGQLSRELHADEFRTLRDLEYLRPDPADPAGAMVPNIVILEGTEAARRLVGLLPDGRSRKLTDLSDEFNAAWLDIMLPGYPAHIRPLARAVFGREATGNTMTAFLLEHLRATGFLGELRPEHRLASQLILFRDCSRGFWDLVGE